MLIKQADDRTSDTDVLSALLAHPGASAETRKKIEQEIRTLSAGIKGEQDAAYEIDFHYGASSRNWAVIHDLRIEHEGRVAQIDHLILDRFLEVWVCESKRFSEGIAINAQGECAMFRQNRPQGIGSPYEQNAKHIAVLKAVCDAGAVELPRRLGLIALKPSFNGLVVVSKNARITRPKSKGWWTDGIVKADQVKAHIDKEVDESNPLMLAKMVSAETLETVARSLASLHRPAAFDWHARFGLPKEAAKPSAPPKSIETPAQPALPTSEPKKSKLACASCGEIVAYNVAKFCWFNKARFGGSVYCMECQKNVPTAA